MVAPRGTTRHGGDVAAAPRKAQRTFTRNVRNMEAVTVFASSGPVFLTPRRFSQQRETNEVWTDL